MPAYDFAKSLCGALSDKSAVVGIFGLGYVGLPLALRFCEAGFTTVGFDVDSQKVTTLNSGRSYISLISNEKIATAVAGGFRASSDFADATNLDVLIICVPTPLNAYREPDLSFITGTLDAVKPFLKRGQLISLESTTYPGTTREEVAEVVSVEGYNVGEDFFVVYSPEREDPGNEEFTTEKIPKIVAGITRQCADLGGLLYSQVVRRVVPVSSTETAELTKLLENIHRAVNIGLVNEMKLIADRMGIDIFEVVDAAATKPFGFTPYYPGPGLGGHCIPIDPFYLTWKAREYGLHTRFIELSGEINQSMPAYVVDKLIEGLNAHKKPLNGSKVLVLGIAYKKNVGDMRESPSVEIMELVRQKSGLVSYADPHVPVFPPMRKHAFSLSSVELSASVIKDADAVILATNHDCFDYELIKAHAQLIVDTRGVYRNPSENIIRA